MNRAFVDAYNRELSLLYERGRQFAEDHPDIAGRMGGLLQDRTDPAVAGLLEGAAFLAARVQMQIDAEFSTFTTELIEQLMPNLTAPTPSALLLQASPNAGDPDLLEGIEFPAGSYVDAQSSDRDHPIACRFRLSAPLELSALEVAEARMLRGATEFQALGLDVLPEHVGGLILRLAVLPDLNGRRVAPLSALKIDGLTVHLAGETADMAALYEVLFAGVLRITLRWRDARNRVATRSLPLSDLVQIGFEPNELLFPEDGRVFRGYAILREFFIFPAKFLGFRLTGLKEALTGIDASEVDILFESDRLPGNLTRIGKDSFRLNVAPAINLFEEGCSSVKPDAKRYEYLVVPDPSPASHFEVHRIMDAWAHYGAGHGKVPVHPLYSLPLGAENPQEALFFTSTRRPRRVTSEERRTGRAKSYPGSETYISIYEPATLDSRARVQRLQMRLLCSNRHLPLLLAPGAATEYRLNEDVTVPLSCIYGPTVPRASVLDLAAAEQHRSTSGSIPWRLISYLSINLLGLQQTPGPQVAGEGGAATLREILSLFTDLSDTTTERQIGAILSMTTRAIVRSIRRAGWHHTVQGTEVTVKFDERPFESSGILPLCAVLERFLADHASVNSFTQLVAVSQQRGLVKTFAPRMGQGPLL